MGKLTKPQIEEFFNQHLPYRNGVLLAHLKLCEQGPWHGNQDVLRACFEASLITGRMYLNVLGLTKSRTQSKLVKKKFDPKGDDLSAEDLGGHLIELKDLPSADHELFVEFLLMTNKGAAHLTLPAKHPWERTHEAIRQIRHYVKVNLYEATNRSM